MGTHLKKDHASSVVIHEYASASVPPFGNIKNIVKRQLNVQPDFRVFLNEFVRQKFQFGDTIPFGYRDLGLSDEFIHADYKKDVQKTFDFIYSGSVSYELKIPKLLDHFTKELNGRSLLVLSKDYQRLMYMYEKAHHISFAGPVLQSEVPSYLLKSRFAINYKPDIEPHNQQTSTKLMEYAACKVPVITSDFAWVRQFQQRFGGEFFYLKNDLSNFTWENVNSFRYSFPDLTRLTWDSRIRHSGVLEFLTSKFPTLKWPING
jgi:glycosyltransferase involved in cell wall biosynthesis